jgi:hypothetical protein
MMERQGKMNRCMILSNNPLVLERFPDAEAVAGGPQEVFTEGLCYLDRGFALQGHPLAGSIRLCCNPFRSLCLEFLGKGQIDRQGVRLLLDAMDRVFYASSERPVPKELVEDYAQMDLELLLSLKASGIQENLS